MIYCEQSDCIVNDAHELLRWVGWGGGGVGGRTKNPKAALNPPWGHMSVWDVFVLLQPSPANPFLPGVGGGEGGGRGS